jgi:hypothetical protein
MAAPAPDITTLLQAWRAGDPAALDELTPIVYDHLRQLGRQYVRHERPDVRGDATSRCACPRAAADTWQT